MNSSSTGTPGEPQKSKLPKRDWILLPLLCLVTVVVLLTAAETAALRLFPDPAIGKGMTLGDCLVNTGMSTGMRGIPNTVCHAKLWESPLIEYRFNSCGDRDDKECHSKPAGTYRIVMLGTSTALGWGVPKDKTFGALLPSELSQKTGHTIDVYNEAMMYQSPVNVINRLDEVLAAKPDLILWTFSPLQPLNPLGELPKGGHSSEAEFNSNSVLALALHNTRQAFASKSIPHAVHDLWGQLVDSRIQFMLQHFSNESKTRYVSSYLKGSEAEFLKTDTYSDEKHALDAFEQSVVVISERSKAAGVPLAVALLPFRAQVAMISMNDWPAGYDPYRMDNELRAIVERHGATYVSVLGGYKGTASPEQFYYPVDGHPTADGHAMLATILAKELTKHSIPGLETATQPTGQSE